MTPGEYYKQQKKADKKRVGKSVGDIVACKLKLHKRPATKKLKGKFLIDHGWTVLDGWLLKRVYVKNGRRTVTEQKFTCYAEQPTQSSKEIITFQE